MWFRLDAKVAQPIAYQQIIHSKHQVVPCYLIKSLLVENNLRCLALHQHQWLSGPIENNNIASPPQLVMNDLMLKHHQAFGIPQLIAQIPRKVLPDPLFRCQQIPSTAENIENPPAFTMGFYIERISW